MKTTAKHWFKHFSTLYVQRLKPKTSSSCTTVYWNDNAMELLVENFHRNGTPVHLVWKYDYTLYNIQKLDNISCRGVSKGGDKGELPPTFWQNGRPHYYLYYYLAPPPSFRKPLTPLSCMLGIFDQSNRVFFFLSGVTYQLEVA